MFSHGKEIDIVLVYEKYLEPLRDAKLKMLEIGLGCDMNYGPGASYHTWLEFFPNVELVRYHGRHRVAKVNHLKYYIEYDAQCVEKWKEVGIVIALLQVPLTCYRKRKELRSLLGTKAMQLSWRKS